MNNNPLFNNNQPPQTPPEPPQQPPQTPPQPPRINNPPPIQRQSRRQYTYYPPRNNQPEAQILSSYFSNVPQLQHTVLMNDSLFDGPPSRSVPPPPRRQVLRVRVPRPPTINNTDDEEENNDIENNYTLISQDEENEEENNVVLNVNELNNNEPLFNLTDEQPIHSIETDEEEKGVLSDTTIENTVSNTIANKCNLMEINLSMTKSDSVDIFEELQTKMHKNIDEFIKSLKDWRC